MNIEKLENFWEENSNKKIKEITEIVNNLKEKINSLQDNKINLEKVKNLVIKTASYYNKLKELCSLKINNNNGQLLVKPFESKNLSIIIKTILNNNIGCNFISGLSNKEEAVFEPEVITNETKLNLIKELKKIIESGKIKLRIIRDQLRKNIKNIKTNVSQEQSKNFMSKIDSIINNSIIELENIGEKKISSFISVNT